MMDVFPNKSMQKSMQWRRKQHSFGFKSPSLLKFQVWLLREQNSLNWFWGSAMALNIPGLRTVLAFKIRANPGILNPGCSRKGSQQRKVDSGGQMLKGFGKKSKSGSASCTIMQPKEAQVLKFLMRCIDK